MKIRKVKVIFVKCSIIRDLMPSYVDKICSKDSVEIIEDHLNKCDKCKTHLIMMQTDYVETIPEPVRDAAIPFKKINKKRRIQVFTAITLTFLLTFIGAMVIQNVGVVNQIFYPMATANVFIDTNENNGDWMNLRFEDEDYLIFEGLFWNKEITNYANNYANKNSEILIRVKDEDGNIVIDDLKILPGSSMKLDNFKNGEKYFFEIKTQSDGLYTINVT